MKTARFGEWLDEWSKNTSKLATSTRMDVKILTLEQWVSLVDTDYNPPVIGAPKDEAAFQSEIRKVYATLVHRLSAFGEEGDYYGISDFHVAPDLRDRPTTRMPPASHSREFNIAVLTRQYYESDFLMVSHQFLASEAPGYRLMISQDFAGGKWFLRISLTLELAQVRCTNAEGTLSAEDFYAAVM